MREGSVDTQPRAHFSRSRLRPEKKKPARDKFVHVDAEPTAVSVTDADLESRWSSIETHERALKRGSNALSAILVSPQFFFGSRRIPLDRARTAYRISDLDLCEPPFLFPVEQYPG
jgi:hypothetical protein